MPNWSNFVNYRFNPNQELSDHDVARKGNHLEGKSIALLVTGSVAAMNSPNLARELRKYGASVTAFVSEAALKYGVNQNALEWATYPNAVVTELTNASEHLKDFDAFLVAPATANTICKVANGIGDTVVTTTLQSALGRDKKILMAPAMHGSLHNRHLTEAVGSLYNSGVFFIAPYDAFGKHNMTDKSTIVADVCAQTSLSNLCGVNVLVTAGPTPVKIDNVRRITNKFSGKLGVLIADELYRQGADVHLLQSYSGIRPPRYISHRLFQDYDEYFDLVKNEFWYSTYKFGVFSAAVADYKPKEVLEGKTPSKGALKTIELTETEKVIDWVQSNYPELDMVTFKYEEGKTHGELYEIAKARVDKGHLAVVANDGSTFVDGKQEAFIVSDSCSDLVFQGKSAIASGVVSFLDNVLEQ